MKPHLIDLPTIPASLWNETMDLIARRLPIKFEAFQNIWKHPWTVSPIWVEDKKDKIAEWRFSVAPGFVNGHHYECEILTRLASDRTIERLMAGGKEGVKSNTVTAWGIELPLMLVPSTRIIGSGSEPTEISVSAFGTLSTSSEPVPKFFKKLGVGDPIELIGNLNSGVQEVITEAQENPRILHAFDIVMKVERNALRIETGEVESSPLGGSSQSLTVTVGRSSKAKLAPTIFSVPKYVPPPPVNPADLFDGAADREADFLMIATVFFLSPVGADLTAGLDGTWTPYVRHNVFWNLAYLPSTIPTILDTKPITIRTGLAGGIGDAIGNQILSRLNDLYSEAVAQATARSMEGRFWSI